MKALTLILSAFKFNLEFGTSQSKTRTKTWMVFWSGFWITIMGLHFWGFQKGGAIFFLVFGSLLERETKKKSALFLFLTSLLYKEWPQVIFYRRCWRRDLSDCKGITCYVFSKNYYMFRLHGKNRYAFFKNCVVFVALFRPTLVKSLASLLLLMKCLTHLFFTKVLPIVPPDVWQYFSMLLSRSNPDCDSVRINTILEFLSTSSSTLLYHPPLYPAMRGLSIQSHPALCSLCRHRTAFPSLYIYCNKLWSILLHRCENAFKKFQKVFRRFWKVFLWRF